LIWCKTSVATSDLAIPDGVAQVSPTYFYSLCGEQELLIWLRAIESYTDVTAQAEKVFQGAFLGLRSP